MFAGNKGVPQFKIGSTGTNLNIPFGKTSSITGNGAILNGLDNLVIGSGYSLHHGTGGTSSFKDPSGNIILGNTTSFGTIAPLINVITANSIIMMPGVTGSTEITIGSQTGANLASNNVYLVPGANSATWSTNIQASNNVAIGSNAVTTASSGGAVAIGYGANTGGINAISVGVNASASNTNGIAIGSSTTSTSGVAIGNSNTNGANISIGSSITHGGSGSLVITNGVAVNTGSGYGNMVLGIGNVGLSTNNNAYINQIGTNVLWVSPGAGVHGATAIGTYGAIDMGGSITHTAGSFATFDEATTIILTGRMRTTDATSTEIGLPGSQAECQTSLAPTGRIILTNNSTYIFDCNIVARKSTTGTDYSAWNVRFSINREANAASTALVGTVTKTLIGQTAGASTWDVNVTADTTNGRPAISLTGQAATTIRWVMTAHVTKVSG